MSLEMGLGKAQTEDRAGALPRSRVFQAFSRRRPDALELDEAADAIKTVEADYRSQAVAARELAADQFGSDKVLTRMLNDIFSADAKKPA